MWQLSTMPILSRSARGSSRPSTSTRDSRRKVSPSGCRSSSSTVRSRLAGGFWTSAAERGFARAIAEVASAVVTGIDYSERFIAFARDEPPPSRGTVEWKVGNAEALPVADGSFDRVLLSLVLHQLRHPDRAVVEAFRVLAAGRRVVVRTVAPEDVASRVPHRFFPTMAATDAERMPPLDTIETYLRDAGFMAIDRRRVSRDSKVNLAHEERQMLVEARGRYSFIPASEIDAGMQLMRAEAKRKEGDWLDPRPAYFIAASKPAD